MKLLMSLVKRLPTEQMRKNVLDHSLLGYIRRSKEKETDNQARKDREIAEIRTKLPADLMSRLRTDMKYTHWKKVLVNYQNGAAPPHYCIFSDPLTIVPDDPKRCVKALSVAKRKSGGRNNTGKICTRRIGGGFKRRIRLLDTKKRQENPQKIVRIEHDPNRSAKLILLQDTITSRLSYRLAFDGAEPGSVISDSANENEKPSSIEPGATLPLKLIPLGSRIHDIETIPNRGAKLVKAAGTHGTLVGHSADLSKSVVRLPSGQQKTVLAECRASLGTVGNAKWHLRVIGKAGRNRNLGIRPHVRGVAMNAVDHPHGGGKGGRGKGKPSQSPWGKVCK